MTKPHVLLTGATGFLGRAIARHHDPDEMTLACTGRSQNDATLPGYTSADLTNPDAVASLADGHDVLLHCAGLAHQFGGRISQSEFQRINVVATQNAVAAAVRAGVRHVVLVSSVSVYGQANSQNGPVNESAACQPEGAYAASKLFGEVAAAQLTEPAGIPLTILRMATIYGEGDPGNVARLMNAIDRRRFVWIGQGRNLKSLVHVDDAAAACLQAVRQSPQAAGTTTYNVSAAPCLMRDVVACISTALKKPVPSIRIPAALPLGVAGMASRISSSGSLPHRARRTLEKWVGDDAYDGSRFCRDFDFQPRVSLQDGIQREADWFRNRAA